MTMLRRQSLIAYGAPLRETTVEAPIPGGREVLVQIARCGVCHSDLHMQDGYFELAQALPRNISASAVLGPPAGGPGDPLLFLYVVHAGVDAEGVDCVQETSLSHENPAIGAILALPVICAALR